VGLLPLVVWEAFALFYYGFPLPNSAYAKLGTGIARADLAAQGVAYLRNSLLWDPVTLAATAVGVGLALAGRRPREMALGAGVLLHLAYVVAVGGDFMSGRFLTPPLLVAVALIARRPVRAPRRWVPAAVALAAAAMLLPRSPLRSGPAYGTRGETMDGQIADERGVYFQRCGLLRAGPGRGLSQHPHAVGARETARIAPPVAVAGNIGIYGYYVGPDVHLIDAFALADPLLARLPVRGETWRVGHYVRAIPPGYGDSLVDGVNRIEDARLAEYWTHLCALTRGPLLSRARLAEIVRFQMGGYRSLLRPFFESYREQHAGMRLLDAGAPGPAIARFERSVALDSTRAAAWWGLARARIATGDPERAVPAARAAVHHGPGRFDEVLVQAAAEAHRVGRPDLAVPALRDYLALHDDGLEARLMLALAFERLGDTDRALVEYERVAGTRPGVPEVEDRIHVLRAGQALPARPSAPSE
jgi:hypothetical protein